jgi:hypothetical protein
MSLLTRLLGGFCVGSALLLTFATLSAEWVFEACTVTDSFGQRISLLEAHRRGERLTREVQATLERIGTKERIAEMVASGEMTLIEAAAWFRALHREPQTGNILICPRPGKDDGKAWCRGVIDYVETKTRFEQSASQADVVRQRLLAELQEQLDGRSNIELPD